MKKFATCFLFCFLLLLSSFLQAQQNKIDSIQNLLKISKDTSQINNLNELSWQYINIGNYEKAFENAKQAQQQAEKLNYKKGIANAYNNTGIIYWNQGNYERSLEAHLKTLHIREEIGDKKGIASSYNNIGFIYESQKNYEKVLEYHFKSLKIRNEIGDKKGIANSYNNIGNIYYKQGNYELALNNYLKSLTISAELGNLQGIAYSYNNIGNIYFYQGNYEKALNNFLKSLKIKKEIGAKQGIGIVDLNIGSTYIKQNKLEEAYHYLNQSLIISREIGDKEGVKEAYSFLSDLYNKKGDYKQAYEYHKLFSDIKDTLLNEESSKQITEMNTKYDSEKKDKELIKKDAEINIQQAETEKQNLQRNAFIIGFALVFVLAFFIFRGYRQKQSANKLLEAKNMLIENQKQLVENKNEIIEEKQKEIISSITYAKRIQNAILPSDKLVKKQLPNSFILYKPKDIVAGDFYWIEKVISSFEQPAPGLSREHQGDVIFIAAADCTGHGVPGAMVSVVCNNSLNRALREFGLRDPGKLLDKTRELVIEQFEKSEEEVKDGMDISLCALNTLTGELQWAGANNPLWIVRNTPTPINYFSFHTPIGKGARRAGEVESDRAEVTETKADKQPIGKFIETKPFTTHTLQLQKGDTIYIFSDGYQDQFGGERGKKFKASAMKELLLSIKHESMEEQKEILNESFIAWKGSLEQVDDVLVIGIKI